MKCESTLLKAMLASTDDTDYERCDQLIQFVCDHKVASIDIINPISLTIPIIGQ